METMGALYLSHDVINKWQKKNEKVEFRIMFNQLHVQRLVCMTVASR